MSPGPSRPVVLFLCVHNSGRSLAAKVLLEDYAQGRVAVLSAGSEPAEELNPSVVAVLRERGLDPSREFPKALTDEEARTADVVVTMGCGDTCPYYPGKTYFDWDVPDPVGQPVEAVRPIVDEIDRRVRALLADLDQSAKHHQDRDDYRTSPTVAVVGEDDWPEVTPASRPLSGPVPARLGRRVD